MKTPSVALWLWYRGDLFRGYQRQVEGPTVQAALEDALAASGIEASPAAAGRTDRGVHARMQVVSFRPRGGMDAVALAAAVAPRLPEGMGIAAAAMGAPAFHAQWSAVSKEYRYRVVLGGADARWAPHAWAPSSHPRLPGVVVSPGRLSEVLGRIPGTRDFIAFHEKSSVQRPRRIDRAELVALAPGVFEVVLVGEGFARYQVRYLVGSAVAVAAGVIAEDDFVAGLESGRPFAGVKAPGSGLILWEVGYPPEVDPFAEARAGGAALPSGPPFSGG